MNGDKIQAELSQPRSIEGKQFSDFVERIYIISDDDLELIEDNTELEEEDFEVLVTRK